MALEWYYVDSRGERVGPVEEATLVAALRAGDIGPSTLAWREGMPGWSALGGLSQFGGGPPPFDAAALAAAAEVVPAGFVRRWAALVLDQLVLTIPAIVIVVVLMFALGLSATASDEFGAADALGYLVYFGLAGVYFPLMESSAWQATLGKRALGIKVVDMDGRRINGAHALGRWFAAALSYLTLFIGFLMAAVTDRKRALHDYVAGTQVVDAWAYTSFPERQKRGLSGCLVAFLVAMLMVPILAILAAIAISQYQDYVIRSQVSEASALADGVKQAVAEAYSKTERMPESNEAAGLAAPEQIEGAYVSYVDVGRQPGRIETGFSSSPPQKANSSIDGKHLYFDAKVGEGSIIWSCSSPDLKQKHCPRSCDCSG